MPRRFSFSVLSVLSVAQSHVPAQTYPPFEFLQSVLSRHRIVFLGDIHPLAEPKLLVSRLIREQGDAAAIDLLALEVDGGHGATRMYDYLAPAGRGENVATALDTATEVVREPLYDVEQEGYRLEFWPSRFALRTAADAMIVFTRTHSITLLH